jgi:phosphotriesterase-related protein
MGKSHRPGFSSMFAGEPRFAGLQQQGRRVNINTAAGAISVDALGKTLMHEHLTIGFPGWESDTTQQDRPRHEVIEICLERIAELKSAGFASMLDPCPNDLGRDVALMAEVSTRAGFNIIFATGLYHHHFGGAPYWLFRERFDTDVESRLAELFVTELTDGVAGTGIKAGVIKVATHDPPFTNYEKMIFRAAARASNETGAPITTHTEAVLGDEQLDLLTSLGVPAHKIIVGHSCGTSNSEYHNTIVARGAYIGFDRFGLEIVQEDAVRVTALMKLVEQGYGSQLIISHDCVWCWRGHHVPQAVLEQSKANGGSLRFTRVIAPMLIEAGMTPRQIDSMLIDNPRRYFSSQPQQA